MTRATGMAMVLAAAAGFGLCPLFAGLAMASGVSPEAATVARFAIPLALLLPWLRPRRSDAGEALRMAALGAANGIGVLLYFRALDAVPAATVVTIYYTYPVFAVAVGWALFGRRPAPRGLVAVTLVVAGAALGLGPERLSAGAAGAAAGALAAPLAFALLIQYLAAPRCPMPLLTRVAACQLGTLAALLPLVLRDGAALLPPSPSAAGALLALGLVTAGVPQILFTRGAPLAGAERTAIAGAAELVVAMAVAAPLLGDPPGPREAAAMAVMMVALALPSGRPAPWSAPARRAAAARRPAPAGSAPRRARPRRAPSPSAARAATAGR